MAQILTCRNSAGEITYYKVRVERRATGQFNFNFPSIQLAEKWLAEFRMKYPSNKPNAESTTYREMYARSVGKAKTFCKLYTGDKIKVYGCELAPGTRGSRCEPTYHCEHYDCCLELADQEGWDGWVNLLA